MQNIFEQKFGKAIDILKIIEKNGYEAYFVGGCVRDYLLDVDFSDIDVTTNALPEQVKEIFGKTIDTGLQHGTVTVIFKGEACEITTFRTESDYSNHRAPDKVEFVRNLKEDLDRRDFTINAMAMDSRGVIYDFHNGVTDLKNGVIRTVNNPSERFYEDALRMLRAFRFSSKLNFEIEENTFFAIKKNAKLIEFVSVERIVSEFKKLLAGVGCKNSLEKLSNEEVKVNIIHGAVGGINESDVMLAAASNAIIIGFNVRPSQGAIDLSRHENVDIRTYRVIYDAIEDIKLAVKGMLAPTFVEEVIGRAEVRATFKVPGIGTVAGVYVLNGKVTRNAKVRLLRDGIILHEGEISSLKRFKDDAKELLTGYEGGLGIANYNDLKETDIIEAYIDKEVER